MPFVRAAAAAASPSAPSSHASPCLVAPDRCLPADSLLPGATPAPAGKGGEAGHVPASLGEDDLAGVASGSGDRDEQILTVALRTQFLLDPGVERGDLGVQPVDVIQGAAGHKRVMITESADQRLTQFGDLRLLGQCDAFLADLAGRDRLAHIGYSLGGLVTSDHERADSHLVPLVVPGYSAYFCSRASRCAISRVPGYSWPYNSYSSS